MTLPEAELSFYFAAVAQLEPALRPVFVERVARLLGAHSDPGPGDSGQRDDFVGARATRKAKEGNDAMNDMIEAMSQWSTDFRF